MAEFWDLFIGYLEEAGKIIVFKEFENLKDKIFINPQKLLNQIYTVLNKKVLDKGGYFTSKQITELRAEEKDVIIQLMLDMDLIFENPAKKREYIAPQFLKENEALSTLLYHFKKILKPSFILRFPDFMPRAYITQFISKYGSQAVEGVFWKFGVLYNHEVNDKKASIKVLVEADTDMQIVRVYAEDKSYKYEALRSIFEYFTIDKVAIKGENEARAERPDDPIKFQHQKSNVLKQKYQMIEYLELSADGYNFATIKTLNEAIDAKVNRIKNKDGNYFEINSIFHYLLNKTEKMPKKIFFSYSRYESTFLDEFKVHFSTLRKQGLIETWYDGEIEAGADANATITKELLNCDIIICLLSPRFMDNDYIWKIEMEEAKKSGKTIIPVSIKSCDYKEYFADYFGEDKQGFLSEKQFNKGQGNVPVRERDVIWIASELNEAKRGEYYSFIVDRIKKGHFAK